MTGGGVAAAESSGVTGATRVRLHALSMRPDDGSWVIGRVETGDFISVPPVGHRVVTLLSENRTVDDVGRRLREESGDDIDVAGFVSSLIQLGFVAAVDGRPVAAPPPPRPSLPWLKPRHTRWLLHPATAVVAAALVAAGVAAAAADSSLIPRYRDLLWSRHGSAVILVSAVIAWIIVYVHELAHLSTARAVGVPARMNLSTRLQFLAVQTDVSGVWGQPRRIRVTVYLAGMTVNLVLAAVGVLVLAAADPPGAAYRLIAATVLLSLLLLPTQLLIFMRTDVYFIVQDLTGCANLYADGSAYLLHHVKRLWYALRRTPGTRTDPSRGLPARQRRAVRAYSLLLVGGTVVCLGVAATITLPVAVTLLVRAADGLTHPSSTTEVLDSAAVFLVIGGFHLLWARTWWRRHGHRVRSHLPGRRNRKGERR